MRSPRDTLHVTALRATPGEWAAAAVSPSDGAVQRKEGTDEHQRAYAELREATDALDESTLSCLGHLADRDSELAEWVRAVAAHSRAVEAAVQRLETNMKITRMSAGLDPV